MNGVVGGKLCVFFVDWDLCNLEVVGGVLCVCRIWRRSLGFEVDGVD